MRQVTSRRRAIAAVVSLALGAIGWLACGGSGDAGDAASGDAGVDARSDAGGGAADAVAPTDAGGGAPDSAPALDGSAPPIDAGASVLEHHKRPSRDGFYVEPSLTKTAAKTMHVDPTFDATFTGPVYAQPLYVEPGPQGKEVLLVATEQNEVYAFDAASGAVVWKAPALGAPVPLSALKADPGCGNIDPLGITGTPYVDLASRTIFLDAMVTPDGGATKKHFVYALSLDDGRVRAGWPVDLEAKLAGAPVPFQAKLQNQRGALALLGGVLYVPFSGHGGDCGPYHGWLIAIPIDNPAAVTGWATSAALGGIWSPAGPTSDGASLFATTGNTSGAQQWGHGEAILRFTKGAVFSGNAADYYAPANWKDLDINDADLGGQSALVVDVPGATPSRLMVAMGKDSNAYLVDRASLGGIGGEIAKTTVADGPMWGAAAVYRTTQGTYVAFHGIGLNCSGAGLLGTFRIEATSPPSITPTWCAPTYPAGSPIATTTDGTSDAIVWSAGDTLRAYDGETGDPLFTGGGAGDALTGGTVPLNTPIAVKGRIFVAAHDRLFAFTP